MPHTLSHTRACSARAHTSSHAHPATSRTRVWLCPRTVHVVLVARTGAHRAQASAAPEATPSKPASKDKKGGKAAKGKGQKGSQGGKVADKATDRGGTAGSRSPGRGGSKGQAADADDTANVQTPTKPRKQKRPKPPVDEMIRRTSQHEQRRAAVVIQRNVRRNIARRRWLRLLSDKEALARALAMAEEAATTANTTLGLLSSHDQFGVWESPQGHPDRSGASHPASPEGLRKRGPMAVRKMSTASRGAANTFDGTLEAMLGAGEAAAAGGSSYHPPMNVMGHSFRSPSQWQQGVPLGPSEHAHARTLYRGVWRDAEAAADGGGDGSDWHARDSGFHGAGPGRGPSGGGAASRAGSTSPIRGAYGRSNSPGRSAAFPTGTSGGASPSAAVVAGGGGGGGGVGGGGGGSFGRSASRSGASPLRSALKRDSSDDGVQDGALTDGGDDGTDGAATSFSASSRRRAASIGADDGPRQSAGVEEGGTVAGDGDGDGSGDGSCDHGDGDSDGAVSSDWAGAGGGHGGLEAARGAGGARPAHTVDGETLIEGGELLHVVDDPNYTASADTGLRRGHRRSRAATATVSEEMGDESYLEWTTGALARRAARRMQRLRRQWSAPSDADLAGASGNEHQASWGMLPPLPSGIASQPATPGRPQLQLGPTGGRSSFRVKHNARVGGPASGGVVISVAVQAAETKDATSPRRPHHLSPMDPLAAVEGVAATRGFGGSQSARLRVQPKAPPRATPRTSHRVAASSPTVRSPHGPAGGHGDTAAMPSLDRAPHTRAQTAHAATTWHLASQGSDAEGADAHATLADDRIIIAEPSGRHVIVSAAEAMSETAKSRARYVVWPCEARPGALMGGRRAPYVAGAGTASPRNIPHTNF